MNNKTHSFKKNIILKPEYTNLVMFIKQEPWSWARHMLGDRSDKNHIHLICNICTWTHTHTMILIY